MSLSESPQRRLSRPSGLTLRPETVAEKTFMESMAGFIHEVVPQAYGSGHMSGEATDPILWAKIEQMDVGDCFSQSSISHKTNLPLVLVLGYTTGVQMWTIQASGEAQEILSWNAGSVKVLRLLPNPVSSESEDPYASKRPLIAMSENTGPASQLHPVAFVSLRTGEQVKIIRFKNPVADILANRRAVVVTFPEKVAVFSSTTFEDLVVLTHCYPPSSSPYSNPVALGSRWLAYAEKRLLSIHRCGGGFEGEGIQSYTATVIHAAKSLTKGLREFGETFLTGQRNASSSGTSSTSQQGPQPGVVTVIDIEGVKRVEVNLREDLEGVVAHFVAHANQAISYLSFDPSGTLLFTADKQGHNFHIFRIHPAPCGTRQSAVHHLYTLYRGDTTARVQSVAFATDSRWVAVTTMRGTTHVFPISPYGGSVGVRTHTSQRVVNRLSRFHRSAGLDDTPSSGRSSPVLSASPNNSRLLESPTLLPYPNPRLPPYPHPIVVTPLVQLRSSFMVAGVGNRGVSASPALSNARKYSDMDDGSGILRVACCFAPARGAATLAGHALNVANSAAHRDRLQRRTAESLYVMSCHGALVEYGLEPRLASGIPREKVCDKSAIELDIVPLAQWPIHRPLSNAADLPPPIPPNILSLITDGPELDLKSESPSSSVALTAKDIQDTWLAQVEINTHAGPHRRLWMGPQFTFKTIKRDNTSSLAEIEASDVDILTRPARSNPVNMPDKNEMPIQGLPVITGEGSASSYEQSPRFLTNFGRERYGTRRCDSESSITDIVPKVEVELQLKENLADAMLEMPSSGPNHPGDDDGSERRTHYFMDDERLNWPQTSVSSSNPPASLNNDEDLLDFELESETSLRSPPTSLPKFNHDSASHRQLAAKDNGGHEVDKDYSFFASDEIVSGVSVDVAFFPDASRSAGESSSNEEDVVTVPTCDQDGSRSDRRSKKNRKKKK